MKLLAAVILGLTAAAPAIAQPITVVSEGRISGAAAYGVAAFKGVPFAAPPVGSLRWRPPQGPAPWSGVRASDAFGPACLQPAISPGSPPAAISEDCLTLNVWTPTRRTEALPVMVWIHGGSFVAGSGSAAVYDGSALARRGVVLVTLNYRLGRFGFFAHPALSAGALGEPVANYGLMDQIAALTWVRRNIAAFGGDPRNVTIFGESSGAASVNRLMISPAARGLFHRAIAQSGNGREYTPRLKAPNPDGLVSAETAGKDFAISLGVADDDAAALRAIPAEKILSAPGRTAIEGGPVIDGQLLTMEVFEAFELDLQAKVPLISGSTSRELPVTPRDFQTRWDSAIPATQRQRSGIAPAYADEVDFQARALSDVVFGEPARYLAAAHTKQRQKAWLYRFSVLSDGMKNVLPGAPHASEIPYVFGNLGSLRWPADAHDPQRSAEIMDYWVAFARHGDPNGDGRPSWPAYDVAEDSLLDFADTGPVLRRTPDAAQLDAIAATLKGR